MPKRKRIFIDKIFNAINGNPPLKNIKLKNKKSVALDAKIFRGVKKFLESPF